MKIKHTVVFNDLWDEVCEGHNDNELVDPTRDKELTTWKNKDKNEYALIAALTSGEVSCHIISIKYWYGALKQLKDLYDSHSELEII